MQELQVVRAEATSEATGASNPRKERRRLQIQHRQLRRIDIERAKHIDRHPTPPVQQKEPELRVKVSRLFSRL